MQSTISQPCVWRSDRLYLDAVLLAPFLHTPHHVLDLGADSFGFGLSVIVWWYICICFCISYTREGEVRSEVGQDKATYDV